MRHGIKLTITVIFFFFSISVSAALYKSVDADGNVSYSQTPPKTGDYKTIKVKKYKPVPENASKISSDAKSYIEDGAKKRAQNDIVKAEEDKIKKIQLDNCNIAKKNLRLFTVYKRLRNEKGEYYRVDDKERESRINAAKENIVQYCK